MADQFEFIPVTSSAKQDFEFIPATEPAAPKREPTTMDGLSDQATRAEGGYDDPVAPQLSKSQADAELSRFTQPTSPLSQPRTGTLKTPQPAPKPRSVAEGLVSEQAERQGYGTITQPRQTGLDNYRDPLAGGNAPAGAPEVTLPTVEQPPTKIDSGSYNDPYSEKRQELEHLKNRGVVGPAIEQTIQGARQIAGSGVMERTTHDIHQGPTPQPTPEELQAGLSGASDLIEGGMTLGSVVPSMAVAKNGFGAAVPIVKGIGTAVIASKIAEKGLEGANLTPEEKRFLVNVAAFVPSAAGTIAGMSSPKVRAVLSPETGEFGAAGEMLGGKVGGRVAVTPEEINLRANIGSREFNKSIPRGQSIPQGPVIEGEPVSPVQAAAQRDVVTAVQAAAESNAHDALVTRAASGQPIVPPAPPEPQYPPVTDENLGKIAEAIKSLPKEQQAEAILEAHSHLSRALLQQGKVFVGGEVHVVDSPKAADKLASKIIAEHVAAHDKAATEARPASDEPATEPSAVAEPEVKWDEPATAHAEYDKMAAENLDAAREKAATDSSRPVEGHFPLTESERDALENSLGRPVTAEDERLYRRTYQSQASQPAGLGPGTKPVEVPAPKQKKVSATDNSVRDLPQQATINGDNITITSKVGKSKAATYDIPMAEWEKAERHPSFNPHYNRRELIRKYTAHYDEEEGGPAQADRIRDAQVLAIEKALAKRTSSETEVAPFKAEKGQKVSFTDNSGKERVGTVKFAGSLAVRIQTPEGTVEVGPKKVKGLAESGAVRSVLESSNRPFRIGGEWINDRRDPIAEEVLPRWTPEHEAFLSKYTQGNPTYLGGGFYNVILDLGGGRVARIGTNPEPMTNIPEVLQPIARDESNGVRIDVMPKVDTTNITENDVREMRQKLASRGYDWTEAGTDNLGRTADGKLVVLDLGGIKKKPSEPSAEEFVNSLGEPAEIEQVDSQQGLTPAGSGTATASNEEVNRSETFYKVSKGGRITYMGKQPDATLRNGEGVVARGADGKLRVVDANGIKDDELLKSAEPMIAKAHEIADHATIAGRDQSASDRGVPASSAGRTSGGTGTDKGTGASGTDQSSPVATSGKDTAGASQQGVKQPWEMTREQYVKDNPQSSDADAAYDRALNFARLDGSITEAEFNSKARRNSLGAKEFWAKTRAEVEQEGKDAVRAARGDRAEVNKMKGGKEFAKWRVRSMSDTAKKHIEFTQQHHKGLLDVHKERVTEALAEGKPVPPEVLADYPELKAPAGQGPESPESQVPESKPKSEWQSLHDEALSLLPEKADELRRMSPGQLRAAIESAKAPKAEVKPAPLPEWVNQSDLDRLNRRIEQAQAKIAKNQPVVDAPQRTPGPLVTGRSNYRMGKQLDAENNRRAGAFAELQQAKKDLQWYSTIRDGYLKGSNWANGQPRKPGQVEARAEAKERNQAKIAAKGFDTRKIHQDLSIHGNSTLADGRVVGMDMDFASDDGGYRYKVTSPDGSEQLSKFYPSISKMQASGELSKMLKAEPARTVVIDKPAEAKPKSEMTDDELGERFIAEMKGDAPIKVDTSKQQVAFTPGSRVAGTDGKVADLLTPSGRHKVQYRVVEAADLVPSHDAMTFAKNERYPEGVQERAYHSSKEAQNRVIQQAQNYEPAWTVNTNPDAVNGPPVVTPDGLVLGGNSRAMSTVRLYKSGNGAKYRDSVIGAAQDYGIGKAAAEGMKQPVLVREVQESPKNLEDMRRLASDLNKPMTGALGVSERAVSAGKSVTPESLNAISTMVNDLGDGSTLRDAMRERGREFVNLLTKDGVITERERPQFVDTATGGLSEEGKTFVERALLGSVIDDPNLMDAVPKSVLNKLEGSLGDFASVGSRTDEYNLMPMLREALTDHAEMVQRGMDVDTFLNQGGMFGPQRNPAVDAVIRALTWKPKEFRAAVRQFAQDANYDVQNQGMLGFGEQPTAVGAFNSAFKADLSDREFTDALLQSVQKAATIQEGANREPAGRQEGSPQTAPESVQPDAARAATPSTARGNVEDQSRNPANGQGSVGQKVVPGARSAFTGNETNRTTMDDLIDSINRQVPEKLPLKERIRASVRAGEKLGEGKDAISKALDGMRGGMAALWSAYRNPRSSILLPSDKGGGVSDYERAVGQWSGADNASALDLYRFRKAYQEVVKDADRDAAITVYNQAGGDLTVIKQWADEAATHPNFAKHKKAFEAALNLTDAEKTIANNIASRNDATLQEAQAGGILNEGRENYMMQSWSGVPEMQAKVRAQANFASLTTKPGFTKERKLDSYFEGIKLGYTPKNMSAGFLTEAHERAFRVALANRAFIRALFEGKASDGRPLVVTNVASAKELSAEDGKSSQAFAIQPNRFKPRTPEAEKELLKLGGEKYRIEKREKPEDGDAERLKQIDERMKELRTSEEYQTGDYRTFDHPALRGWKWTEELDGKPLFVQGDALVHPEIYRHLTNNLKRSWVQDLTVNVGGKDVAIGKGALAANAALKQAVLSVIPARFHRTTLELHALEHRTNPWNLVELDLNQPDQRALVNGGLMVANYDGQDGWTDGLGSTSTLLKHIPWYGAWAQAHSDKLFKEFLPQVKMTTGLNALKRNRERYAGKYTDEKIAQITAKEMNAAFGAINYKYLGRNKTAQDVFRLAVLAPDFLEARARFVAQAGRPQGAEQLHAYLLGGLVLYSGIALLNMATDGDPHLDKPMTLVVHGKEYEFRTVQMDTLHAVTDPFKFVLNRRAPLLKMGTDPMLEDPHFQKKNQGIGNKLWKAAKGNAPMPLQPWLRENSKDSTVEKATEMVLKYAGINVRNEKRGHPHRKH